MIYFYIYVANVLFVLTVIGLFAFFATRFALKDGKGLVRMSLRSIAGRATQFLFSILGTRRPPEHQQLQVQGTIPGLGISEGQLILLALPITTIGRSEHNHIKLTEDKVSSRHASLICNDGRWLIEDNQSTNGTVLYPVDGTPISVKDRPERINGGDVFRIGSTRFKMME